MAEQGDRPVRIVWLDAFRATAVILIVAYHMAYLVFPRIPLTRDVVNTLTEAGTMMFVFISGFLFRYLLPLERSAFRYWPYLKRRVIHIALPYAVATLILLLLRQLKMHSFELTSFPIDFGKAFLTGGAAVQLWFIPMLLLLYLAAPFFLWLDRHERLYPFSLLLVILPLALGRGAFEEFWRNSAYFLPFYIWGMWAATAPRAFEALLDRFRIVIGGVLLGFIVIVATWVQYDPILTLAKIAFGASLLLFYQRYAERVKSCGALGVLDVIATCSLGIFFYHNTMIGQLFAPLWKHCSGWGGEVWALIYWGGSSLICTALLTLLLLTARWVLVRLGVRNTRMIQGA